MESKGLLIILTGKTASGKDTVMKRVLQNFPGMTRVVTTTSRPPRSSEKDGADYNFISKEEFNSKIEQREFLEYVEYGGNWYGTEKSQIMQALDGDLIWRIDPSRAGQIRQLVKGVKVLVIYLTVEDKVVLNRLKDRSLSDDSIQKRMEQDLKFWNEYSQNYDFVVENPPGNLEKCVKEVIQIIQNHQPK